MNKIRLTKRNTVLGGLLLVSILAAVGVSRDGGDNKVIQAAGRKLPVAQYNSERSSGRSQNTSSSVAEEQVDKLALRQIDGDLYPLFPAAPKVVQSMVAAAPPPPPTAPPLPFKFLGQMIENGKVTVFLSLNDRNMVVKAGDTIDDLYHVDAIVNGGVEFTYLPLQQKQTLPAGGNS